MVPNLIHPIPVYMARLDRDATIFDDKAKEPIGRSAVDTQVQLSAQVKWKQLGKPDANFSGPREQDMCYLLFRHIDLAGASVVIKRGDRFKRIGNRDVNLFVTYFEDMGHYQDQGGATLLKVWLADRRPSELEGDLG